MKKIIAAAVIAALLGTGGWYLSRSERAEDNPAVAWGSVDTRQVSLAFEGSGRILSLAREEGERVAAGDRLGELDTEALRIALREAEASAEALRAVSGAS